MALRKNENLHIRVTGEWLQKLDYLWRANGFTSRSEYIKTMVEANYAVDKELGDKLFSGLVEEAKEGAQHEATSNE